MVESQGKILVVDGEMKNVKLLEALLAPRSYEVITAFNGEEALQQVQRAQPDLVLLDVMMPIMDGFTVCKKLKANDETLLIPVIIMTALDRREDRIKGIEAGADDFLTKPVHRDELLARIRTSLQKKRSIESRLIQHDPNMSRALLAKAPLFAGLSETILDEILRQMSLRHFNSNEFLCRQGEPGESLFVIQSGLVEVLSDTPEGMQPVDRLRPGEVVGEMSLVTGEPRTASIVALAPTDTLELQQEIFASITAQHPTIFLNISRISMQRLKVSTTHTVTPQPNPAAIVMPQPSSAATVVGSVPGPSGLVFISHASSDKETANTVCRVLEARGIGCWIAPRDAPPGARYGAAIVQAIESSVAVVLLFSEHANISELVMNEVERAVSHQKLIFPIRIDQVTPSSELAYFISRRQWLDSTVAPLQAVVEQLATALHSLLASTTSSHSGSSDALQG